MNIFEYLNMFVTLFDTTQATLGSGIGDPGKARLMLAHCCAIFLCYLGCEI